MRKRGQPLFEALSVVLIRIHDDQIAVVVFKKPFFHKGLNIRGISGKPRLDCIEGRYVPERTVRSEAVIPTPERAAHVYERERPMGTPDFPVGKIKRVDGSFKIVLRHTLFRDAGQGIEYRFTDLVRILAPYPPQPGAEAQVPQFGFKSARGSNVLSKFGSEQGPAQGSSVVPEQNLRNKVCLHDCFRVRNLAEKPVQMNRTAFAVVISCRTGYIQGSRFCAVRHRRYWRNGRCS